VSLDPAYLRQLLERFEKNSARQGGPPGPAPLRLDLLTGGQSIEQSLGFQAGAVAVDNHTAAYAYLQQIDRYIPPGKTGVAFPMNGETEVGLRFQAPPNVVQPAAPSGQVCSFTFFPQGAGVSPASGVPTDVGRSPQPVATGGTQSYWNFPAGLLSETPNILVPAGAKGVALYSGFSSSSGALSLFTLLQVFLTLSVRNADGSFSPVDIRIYDSNVMGLPKANKLVLRFDDTFQLNPDPAATRLVIGGNPGAGQADIFLFWLFDEPGAVQLLPGSLVQLAGSADVSDRTARLLGHVRIDDYFGAATGLLVGASGEIRAKNFDPNSNTAQTVDAVGRALDRPGAYDGIVNTRSIGTQTTVTLAAVAGKRWIAAAMSAAIVSQGGAAAVLDFYLRDGASGAGTVIWHHYFAYQGAVAGTKDQVIDNDLAIPGSVNTAMTAEFANGIANVFEEANLGAWLG
jgi:hypothetical protein